MVITLPDRWRVTLGDSAVVTIWSSSCSIDGEDYLFDTLVDASLEEQANLEISAHTPTNPERVLVVNARIPKRLVVALISGSDATHPRD